MFQGLLFPSQFTFSRGPQKYPKEEPFTVMIVCLSSNQGRQRNKGSNIHLILNYIAMYIWTIFLNDSSKLCVIAYFS